MGSIAPKILICRFSVSTTKCPFLSSALVFSITRFGKRHGGIGIGFYLRLFWRLSDLSRGVHAIGFPPLFWLLGARLPWALSLFKGWVCSGFLSLSFSFFSSVGIIHFATTSVVRVVVDFFINQGASKLFIDFCFVFSEVRNSGFLVLARVCSSCAGVNIY